MSEFCYYRIGYGLVTKHDPITENCNLFYACDLELQKPLSDFDHACAMTFFHRNMLMKMNLEREVYNRRPHPDSRSVSQDEIFGFMIASKILGTEHRYEIWQHLKTHLGSYNNTGRLLDYLPFNPSNYYSWGQYADSWLACIWFPFYFVGLIIALSKDKNATSSRIIYWVDLNNLPNNFLNRFLKRWFELSMVKMYGQTWLEFILRHYHNQEDETFPIFQHLKNYKK